jgi:hypothetical protein
VPAHTGAPAYLSFPHFYQADPALLDAVEGLKPEKEKHQTYFLIQPVSYVIDFISYHSVIAYVIWTDVPVMQTLSDQTYVMNIFGKQKGEYIFLIHIYTFLDILAFHQQIFDVYPHEC